MTIHITNDDYVLNSTDPSRPGGTLNIYDNDTDDLLSTVDIEEGGGTVNAVFTCDRGYYDLRLEFTPTPATTRGGDTIDTHNSSSLLVENVYLKGYTTSFIISTPTNRLRIMFAPSMKKRGIDWSRLFNQPITVTFPDNSSITRSTGNNTSMNVYWYEMPNGASPILISYAGSNVNEPCSLEYTPTWPNNWVEPNTPSSIGDWRQLASTSGVSTATMTSGVVTVPSNRAVLLPVQLTVNTTISFQVKANLEDYLMFGLWNNSLNDADATNFNLGSLVNFIYEGGTRLNGLGGGNVSNTGINSSSYVDVEISVVNRSVSFKIGSDTYTLPNNIPSTITTLYFLFRAGDTNTAYIKDLTVNITHTLGETITGGGQADQTDIITVEGAPVSDNNLPRILFSDSNYLKTQSTSLLGENNGERLWLSANSSGRNTVCSKYIVLHRGETIEMAVYVNQNDINNSKDDLWIGLTTGSTTTWNTINSDKIVAFRQYHGGGSVYTGSSQTSTGTPTLGASYKWIKFSSDDDGLITVTIDGTSYTTSARVPTGGAYWFISSNQHQYTVGILRIQYHSYGGGGAITSPHAMYILGTSTEPYTTNYIITNDANTSILNNGQTLNAKGRTTIDIPLWDNMTVSTSEQNYSQKRCFMGLNTDRTGQNMIVVMEYSESNNNTILRKNTTVLHTFSTNLDSSWRALKFRLINKRLVVFFASETVDTGYTFTEQEIEDGVYLTIGNSGNGNLYFANTRFEDN